MATTQTADEMIAMLARLEGEEVAALQILGINSLKSMSPMPEALAGELISTTQVEDRLLTISTAGHQVVVDLQRTGTLVWLSNAEPYVLSAGSARPTVRLILASGQGLDMTEPAKTKRIKVTLSTLV